MSYRIDYDPKTGLAKSAVWTGPTAATARQRLREEHMNDIERQVVWVVGSGHERRADCPPSHFTQLLIELCFQADQSNQARLALGFPEVVAAVQAWQYGDLAERALAEIRTPLAAQLEASIAHEKAKGGHQ